MADTKMWGINFGTAGE
jgi:hypothetical protein